MVARDAKSPIDSTHAYFAAKVKESGTVSIVLSHNEEISSSALHHLFVRTSALLTPPKQAVQSRIGMKSEIGVSQGNSTLTLAQPTVTSPASIVNGSKFSLTLSTNCA